MKFKRMFAVLLLAMGLIVANAAEAVGAVGPQGPQGVQGKTGKTGATGAKGIRGDTGLPGDKGITGNQGKQGAAGPKGGAKGDQGLPGDKGDKGDAGTNGAKGDQGSAGTFPVGIAIGDMQWWNGSSWVRIPVGVNNATLKSCNGIPTWVASAGSCPFLIGDPGPAGGIIFYLSDNSGLHGLEAAPVDQANSKWGCSGTAIDGTISTIGTGLQNTIKIVARCAEPDTAAKNAQAYTLNGFSDWYLPSKDELNIMYASIGPNATQPLTNMGNFAHDHYWSSTEIDIEHAWGQNFCCTIQVNGNKVGNVFRVRAVRTF